MKNFSTWMILSLDVIFWLLRVVATYTDAMAIEFMVKPMDVNTEILLLFVALLAFIFIAKRKIFGGVLYLVAYGGYFGVYLWNTFILKESAGDFMNIFFSFIGIVLALITLLDLLLDKNRKLNPTDRKTDWFYKDKKYDMQKDEILYENYLTKEKVLEIIELCDKNSIYYNIYTENAVLAKSLNYNVAFYNYENTKKSSDKKTDINIVEDMYNYIKNSNLNKFLKITICDENKIVFSSILRKIKNISDIDVLEVSHMSQKKIKTGTKEVEVGYFYTEVSSKNVDKWFAIEKVMELENIKKEEVMALGDNNNDIVMIKNAGLGVAMGHSNEQVKKVADYITVDNNEDGVAKAIEQYVLQYY